MKSHRMLILAALRNGARITPLDALQRWGCFRLGARIWDLKRAGIRIDKEMIGSGKTRFACYFLKPEFRNLTPDFSRISPNKLDKSSGKVFIRNSKTGRRLPTNNPLTKEIANRARAYYSEGATLREVYQEFPDISQWQIYKDLQRQGLLRHRGQRKDSGRQLVFSELGGR